MQIGERFVSGIFNLFLGACVGGFVGLLGYATPCESFVLALVVWSAAFFGVSAFLFGEEFGAELAVLLVSTVVVTIFVFFGGTPYISDPKPERYKALLLIAIWGIISALILFKNQATQCF